MTTCITIAGENLIAAKQGAGEALLIDKFIVANVPGLDPAVEVNRTEGMPNSGHIVYEYTIPDEYKGYVNPNQVVYSMLLGADVGDFDFNWLGLVDSDSGTVVAITHLPMMTKRQTNTVTGDLGNALTRNFLLEFSGAKGLTEITIEASTWQIDFTARLKGVDERERLSNQDIYGTATFFGDAYKVVKQGANYVLQPGRAYVSGVRLNLNAAQPVTPGALPKDIWLDVVLMRSGSDVVAQAVPVVGSNKTNYVDDTNEQHYLYRIASINAAGVVTDRRRVEEVATDVLAYLLSKVQDTLEGLSIDQIDGLQAALNGKSSSVHRHSVDQIDDLKFPAPAYVGEHKFFPFPANELPSGWYHRNGDKFPVNSPQGQALRGLSATHRTKWRIIESSGQINLPNAYESDGRGHFTRAGTTPGVVQGDAIRNIIGTIGGHGSYIFNTSSTTGVFAVDPATENAFKPTLVSSSNYHRAIFDASTVVPTAKETLPLCATETPAIYLGV